VTEACDVAVAKDSHYPWEKWNIFALDNDALSD
jgi:hypothetical protein